MRWRDFPDDQAVDGDYPTEPVSGRRVAVRLTLGVGAVLAAAVLGGFAADVLGLTGLPPAVVRVAPGAYPDSPAQPSFAQPLDLDVNATPPPPAPVPAAATGPEPVPEPVPVPPPAPAAAPVPTVKLGDSCTTEGAAGVTSKGKVAVCTSGPGNGRNRWRLA